VKVITDFFRHIFHQLCKNYFLMGLSATPVVLFMTTPVPAARQGISATWRGIYTVYYYRSFHMFRDHVKTAVPWRAVFPNRSANCCRYRICENYVTAVPWRAVLCCGHVRTPFAFRALTRFSCFQFVMPKQCADGFIRHTSCM